MTSTVEYMRSWRKKNPEKIREKQRLYVQNHRKEIAVYQKAYRIKNIEKFKERVRIKSLTPRGRYSKYKSNARHRGHVFPLTFEQFLAITSQICHYCLIDKKIGIDRKDNGIGYEPENCLPCCGDCNRFKGASSYDCFRAFCLRLSNNIYGHSVDSSLNPYVHVPKTPVQKV